MCLLLVAGCCGAAAAAAAAAPDRYKCIHADTKNCQTLYSWYNRVTEYVLVAEGFVFSFVSPGPLQYSQPGNDRSQVLRCRQEQPKSCEKFIDGPSIKSYGSIAVLRPGELVITSGEYMLACGIQNGTCKEMTNLLANKGFIFEGLNSLVVANNAVYAGELMRGQGKPNTPSSQREAVRCRPAWPWILPGLILHGVID